MISTEFLHKLSDLIHKIDQAPIIENSFFVLGAGNFGRSAIQYALLQPNSPSILLIDKEINKEYPEFQDATNITNIHEVLSSDSQRKFYLQKDIGVVSDILQNGFPKMFIPAVPIHAVAYIVAKLFSSLQTETKLNTCVPESVWEEIKKSIPESVILKEDYENGVILLSWAKIDEICPPNCHAPLDYCPHHNRDKPQTITEISQAISIPDLRNFTIESHQVQPGLGIINGLELKQVIVDCFREIHKNFESNLDSMFFNSTTCNCHGVLNVFSVKK